MSKTVVVVFRSNEDLVGTEERKLERKDQIDKMVAEGKTDGISMSPTATSVELTFVDQEAAEEWLTWGKANLAKYGITAVGFQIR